jgi:pro-apoptotic serine protease NMA111
MVMWSSFVALWVALSGALGAEANQDEWSQVLETAVPAVVSIKVTGTRNFDTEKARSGQGTGFVVDKERGIILTNRHMVHSGPIVAEAVFLNHEEVPLKALYRDPVHDFGFYQFDPEDVQYMDVVELPLDPDGARVGASIRVIGNDSGEKLSILDGTLARLDRNAPAYGRASYNDFNTFYIQAASNTSGGSSGSPVIDRRGAVVALNAGGKRTTASSFYLPLHRAQRAFELIREGQEVSRGTLQTTFVYVPFDELGRLGLSSAVEAAARARRPESTGMLVVERVGPEGPADGMLQPGDVLVSVDDEPIDDFVGLEALLDEAVGQEVAVAIERGGQGMVSTLTVQDLESISPFAYLEMGRAVFNDLSYQRARNYHIPVKGVYLATSGYMMLNAHVPPGAVITHVDGVEVPDLVSFRDTMVTKADGQRVRFRFFSIKDFRHAYETVGVVDRQWFSMRYCERAPAKWRCVDSPAPPGEPDAEQVGALALETKDKLEARVRPALVIVEFDVPYPTAGVQDLNYRGVGTIVDAEQGLVVVDRDTVPVGLGDIEITFADAVRVPGELAYLHPTHNLAILRYDPKAVGDLPVAEMTLASTDLEEGDKSTLVGLNGDSGFVSEKVKVERVSAVKMLPARTPRFRDANMDILELDTKVSTLGGLLLNKRGEISALWASFFDPGKDERRYHGLPVSAVRPAVDALRGGEPVGYRLLGVEFTGVSFADARDRGVSAARLQALQDLDPKYRKALQVFRRAGGTPASELLRDADILVAVDGEPVNRLARIDALWDREAVSMTLVRDGQEVTVELPTSPVDGQGVSRIVVWAGMIVHAPHYEVAAQRGLDPEGVYVAWMWYGSPASRYGIRATRRVLAIDDQPVADLDAFINIVRGMTDRQAVRIQLEGLDGAESVSTLKLDLHYWPTAEIVREQGKWKRILLGKAVE